MHWLGSAPFHLIDWLFIEFLLKNDRFNVKKRLVGRLHIFELTKGIQRGSAQEINVNDMTEGVSSYISLFADDATDKTPHTHTFTQKKNTSWNAFMH